jgi:hypothetical protein
LLSAGNGNGESKDNQQGAGGAVQFEHRRQNLLSEQVTPREAEFDWENGKA